MAIDPIEPKLEQTTESEYVRMIKSARISRICGVTVAADATWSATGSESMAG